MGFKIHPDTLTEQQWSDLVLVENAIWKARRQQAKQKGTLGHGVK